MTKTALVTGITGQDGYYLSHLLLNQGYRVVGLVSPHRQPNLAKLGDLATKVEIYNVDLRDPVALLNAVEQLRPQEIYNLAAPSFVPDSWKDPLGTLDLITGTATRLLDAVRQVGLSTRFYQASSSEMFGDVLSSPQDEETSFRPKNPYAAAKLHAHWTMVHHRQRYGLFACSGILYNHESPLRPPQFVTRKVSLAAASIKLGLAQTLEMGNLDAKRDWGFAGDYVKAMWLMLQAEEPEEYVIGTGKLHSVKELVSIAFDSVGLNWQNHVVINTDLLRQDEHFQLVANPIKAKRNLGWETEVSFEGLLEKMVQTDVERLQSGNIAQAPEGKLLVD
ncbi:Short-chain dehydrogenase/reductase SDR [Trichormus variabilis ATCC 29413]|uniref:GDP-mannose 4,6-dehydratase n=2 Tax=Anabaena variabilis TaxID=264691 RepID=Q3M7I5_TRIV2|nr:MULTISPECIES: GDP-mannose 4,6-dehydratase [Nostocaceae]ABA23051.1 Short-chain dehydrogenase/reductase SDR [Trichormus variabilis ATCC 29413]MBC1215198.1 GDP-mannose 4,6-dehydratase [Trichormus variabilis ARAD]MBC1254099.1 GDP-mannose 4,6-dehydratase [Trichormus variabilis V5]MBC1265673.1 GDP-mannose 4,6-dehydratase [Trichormus variabilis FSR]MBC1303195.1 GDP-mannose 4,6-dehydratase [Trichormus variabilis N2B]